MAYENQYESSYKRPLFFVINKSFLISEKQGVFLY